jgi:hypothetical protein
MAIGQSIAGGLAYKNSKEALKAQKEAAKDLTARMGTSKADYQARRPEAQQERERSLATQLGLLGPSNSLVNEMSGGKYSLDLGPALSQSPVSMRPVQSQLGTPGADGRYDPSTVAALRAQGYDVSGIQQARRDPGLNNRTPDSRLGRLLDQADGNAPTGTNAAPSTRVVRGRNGGR